ncbi:hypothetical protein [Candidatus Cardinium sp. cByotN1]|nr:hypothetical protein [Candidatus Cardinium sp. cByotN1]
MSPSPSRSLLPNPNQTGPQNDKKDNKVSVENTKDNDYKKPENELKNKEVDLLAQKLISTPATPPKSTNSIVNQHTSQENVQETYKIPEQQNQNMDKFKEELSKAGVPKHQIEELVKITNDGIAKLKAKLLKLPPDKQQGLYASMERKEKLQKDISEAETETETQLNNLLEKGDKKDLQIEASISEPSLKNLIEVCQKQSAIARDYIDPKDNISLYFLQVQNNILVSGCKVLQTVFLQCSAEDKQALQTSLNNLVNLCKSNLEETKAIKQLIPDSIVKEIQQVKLETAKKQAEILQKIEESIIEKTEEKQQMIEPDLD